MLAIFTSLIIAFTVFCGCSERDSASDPDYESADESTENPVDEPSDTAPEESKTLQMLYDDAISLIEEEKCAEAYDRLVSCGDFEDSKELLKSFAVFYGKTVQNTYDPNGKLTEKLEREYNENGDVTLEIQYGYDGVKCKTEYEYTDQRIVYSPQN